MISISEFSVSKLLAMVGRDAEDARLEFKVDIPVHQQSRKDQALKGIIPPRDGWWSNKPIADHGRDRLLEEIVAFANAQGGRLLLGIDEEDGTTLAKAICPLPRIADLEARFRDFLLSGVEPRLPYVEIFGLETDGRGGGVLVVDVEPSRLGPHRVVGSRQVTIRRGDKCVPMTMAEVHEMVLRNSRRFDVVRTALASRADNLRFAFRTFLKSKVGSEFVGGEADDRVEAWRKQKNFSALAIRINVHAHDDVGISRLGSFDPLVPPRSLVKEQAQEGTPHSELTMFWPDFGRSERFLGGVRQALTWRSGEVEFKAHREGIAEQTIFLVHHAGLLTQTPRSLAGYVGCCMACYDSLRKIGGTPSMPAEVSVSVLTRGTVYVANTSQLAELKGGKLPAEMRFPHRTIASAQDFTGLLNATVQDFFDGANVSDPPSRSFACSLG